MGEMVCIAAFIHYSFTYFPNESVFNSEADWFNVFKEIILTLLFVEYRCLLEKS